MATSASSSSSSKPHAATSGEAKSQVASLRNHGRLHLVHQLILVLVLMNAMAMINLPGQLNLVRPRQQQQQQQAASRIYLTSSAFSVGRFGWPGLEWREIIDWWTSGYSRGVVIGRNYIPPCKLCDMPRMFRVDK